MQPTETQSNANRMALLREKFGRSLKLLTAVNTTTPSFAKPFNDAHISLWCSLISDTPLYIYRVDSAADHKSFLRRLNDIREKRLYLAPPDSFNDSYDTFAYIDPNVLADIIDKNITAEEMDGYLNYMRRSFWSENEYEKHLESLSPYLDNLDLYKKELAEHHSEHAPEYINEFRSHIRVACLTEDIEHEQMWAWYSARGNGIAAQYEISSPDAYQVLPLYVANAPITLCPVQYGERLELKGLSHAPFNSQPFIPYWTEATYLALINMAAHKSDEWAKEKEWRFVTLAGDNAPKTMYLSVAPTGLFLGKSLSEGDSALALEVAAELGIPAYKAEPDYRSKGTKLSFKQIA